MKLSAVVLGLVLTIASMTHAEDVVIHPAPQEPHYIAANLLSEFKKNLAPPPAPKSSEQNSDEAELRKWQLERKSADCKRAESEVAVSVSSFFGPPYGRLSVDQAKQLAPFFEQIRNDADYYIQALKKEFPRQRPFLYITGLSPCVPKEVTMAYPSGHSTIARLYALILGDIYPALKDSFLKRADQIALDRVISGMHHPTDTYTGKKLGDLVFAKLKANNSYEASFRKLKETAP